jgi:DNA-binding NarL/FixJ family response regulator
MATLPIKVAIVEDDARVRESLAVLIGGVAGFRCLGTFPNGDVALKQIPRDWPDVVIMDIHMPNLSGIECVAKLKALNSKVHFIMLTAYGDDEQIFESLKNGASGYLLKNTPPGKILEAITEVHAGGAPMSQVIALKVVQHFQQLKSPGKIEDLSEREQQILNYLVKGYRNKEIADAIGLSFDTIRTHLKSIYHKLHVSSRTEAVIKYLSK